MNKIMIVDDESGILHAIRRELKPQDWAVEIHESASDALKHLEFEEFDLVISDFRMPEMNGVDFLRHVKERWPNTVRLILSGYTDVDAILKSLNEAEIYRYITKPWESEQLIETLKAGLDRRQRLLRAHELLEQEREAQNASARYKRELAKLEAEEPGITDVNWGPNDTVLLEPKK